MVETVDGLCPPLRGAQPIKKSPAEGRALEMERFQESVLVSTLEERPSLLTKSD